MEKFIVYTVRCNLTEKWWLLKKCYVEAHIALRGNFFRGTIGTLDIKTGMPWSTLICAAAAGGAYMCVAQPVNVRRHIQ